MRGIAWILAIGILAAVPADKPLFAGWIRRSTGAVEFTHGAGPSNGGIPASSTTGQRLYAGQKIHVIRGVATLLIYGRQFDLTPAKGWYTIPNDARKKPPGSDIYAKYISRAGRTRGDEMAEQLWVALTLADLTSWRSLADHPAHIRLVPAKTRYRVGERISIEVENAGDAPFHMAVLDIDCEGKVTPLVKEQKLIPAHSGWTRIGGTFALGLPAGWKEGTEQLKFLATQNRIDLAGFDPDNRTRFEPEAEIDLHSDPLAYLLRTLNGDGTPSPGSWTTVISTFTISRSK